MRRDPNIKEFSIALNLGSFESAASIYKYTDRHTRKPHTDEPESMEINLIAKELTDEECRSCHWNTLGVCQIKEGVYVW